MKSKYVSALLMSVATFAQKDEIKGAEAKKRRAKGGCSYFARS
jgi:hypothetical protein